MKNGYEISHIGQQLSICRRNRFRLQSFAYVLILSIFVLNLSTNAAIVDRQVTGGISKYDSINVVRYEDAAFVDSTYYLPDGTGHDSTSFDSTFSIDNTKYTYLDIRIKYHGDNVWKSWPWVFVEAASASISTADKEDIAQLVLDTATAYPGIFYGPGAGSGGNAVIIGCLDTSGTDVLITGVTVTVRTLAGVDYAKLTTASNGYTAAFGLGTDSYVFICNKEGYTFSVDTIAISGNATDTVQGRNYAVASPSAADVSRAYAWVRDAAGEIVSEAVLYATPEGQTIQDTCNNTTIVRKEMRSQPSDSDSGYIYLDLTKSKCYNRQNKYTFYIKVGNEVIYQPKKLTVPDSTTWALPIQ